jgi:hypothetical protein
MTIATAPAPSHLRTWLTGALLALAAFGACWTGAIVYWRSHTGDPGTGEVMLYLFLLPGALLGAALVTRKLLADAPPAPASAPEHASQSVEAAAPAPAVPPIAILATTVRSPHGASLEEIADALTSKKARSTLDATLVDDDSFPLMTARCANADDAAVSADIEAWLTANAPTAQFSNEPARALVLATQVVAELTGKAIAALAPEDQAAPMLHIAAVLPPEWNAGQQQAAARWLQHTVVQAGWPVERTVLVTVSDADLAGAVPTALLAQLATQVSGAPAAAMLVACDSRIGDATVQDWTASQSLFTPANPHGKVPGEGACGLLLTGIAQAAASETPLFAVLEPIATARLDASADQHRGEPPRLLADLTQGALATAHIQADTLAMIVADTTAIHGRMLELMGYAGKAAPQLDTEQDVIAFGRASGACGAVPALTSLALAGQYACERNGPVLWLTNDDAFQRCAAVVRPAPIMV